MPDLRVAPPLLPDITETDPEPGMPPAHSLGNLVRETQRAFARSLSVRIEPYGVTMGMWFFLRVLWEADGISQRELSQRVGMMEPTTVTALNKMQKAGLVRRERNAGDRRVFNVFLTETGRALKPILLPLAAEVNRMAQQGVAPEEMEIARRALVRVRANLIDDPLA